MNDLILILTWFRGKGKMKEKELFEEYMLAVMEFVAECRKLNKEQYIKLKTDVLQSVPKEMKQSAQKIFFIVDAQLERKKENEL